MLYEYAYYHWCASVFQRVCDIAYYQMVTLFVICQLMQYLTIAQFVIAELAVSSETGMSHRLKFCFAIWAAASSVKRIGPHCMKMMGWWPSLRIGVAVSPYTYCALAYFSTCSKLEADTW